MQRIYLSYHEHHDKLFSGFVRNRVLSVKLRIHRNRGTPIAIEDITDNRVQAVTTSYSQTL